MDLPCQILVRSRCCFQGFRLYLGHIGTQVVSVAIRHLSSSEMKKGLGCISKGYWLKMPIIDVTSDTRHQVLINKRSLIKNLAKAGIAKATIDRCIKTSDFSYLGLQVELQPCVDHVSSPIFFSYGSFD